LPVCSGLGGGEQRMAESVTYLMSLTFLAAISFFSVTSISAASGDLHDDFGMGQFAIDSPEGFLFEDDGFVMPEIGDLFEDGISFDVSNFGGRNVPIAASRDEDPSEEVAESVTILGGGGGSASVGLLASDGLGTTIEVDVQGLEVEELMADGAIYQLLSIEGRGYTSVVGKPQLPVIRETLAIPEGAVVRATVLNSSYSTYVGYRIYPVQPPEVDGEVDGDEEKEGDEFLIDGEFYSQDAFYPQEVVEVGEPGVWRDLTVADLQVNPVIFNPATGVLRVYDHVTIKVEYVGGAASATKAIEPKFSEMYRKVILNYEALDVEVGTPDVRAEESVPDYEGFNLRDFDRLDETAKFLLLYHEDCSTFESLEPLVEMHQQDGLSCEVWNISAGSRPAAEEVKALIAGRYAAHPELEYVLLVGDIDLLPWNTGWNGIPGDYWYSCIAGDDLWPELAVGRLPALDEAEVSKQVKKILTYERDPPSGDWSNRVLLVAHREEAPGKYQGCKESIRTGSYPEPLTFETAYGAAPAQGGDGATNADLKKAVDAGVGILNYRGHGSAICWGPGWNVLDEEYSTTEVHALENGNMTPVVFSIACYNAALDHPGECLGEVFVKDDDAAVVFLGSTRPSYTTPNHDFDHYLFEAIGDEEILDIGWALNYANSRLINDYGPASYFMDNLWMYLLLGDPALTINVALPKSPPNASETQAGSATGYPGVLRSYSTNTNQDVT